MPILPYVKSDVVINTTDALLEAYENGVRTKSLLMALGDYWSDYYLDSDTLAKVATGAVSLYSQEYSKILDYVLSSNILDIPIEKPVKYQLLAFSENYLHPVYTKQGDIEYYYIQVQDINNIDYLCGSLFEPGVILENGKHFLLVGNELRFYVNLFEDTGISNYAYTTGGTPYKQIFFWATNIVFKDSLIFDKYGTYIYSNSEDNESYKWLITALMHFYVSTKSIKRIEAVLNVLYGLPISRYSNEKVIGIYTVGPDLAYVDRVEEASFYKIVTDKNIYYAHTYSELLVTSGQILNDYQLLAKFHIVEDYLSNPNWYRGKAVPKDLIVSNDYSISHEELLHNILKYNIVYVKMVITYETYATYKEQISELYEIIKSGFPVYLYPFVDFVFKAVFHDTVVSDDSFRLGRCTDTPIFDVTDPDGIWPPWFCPFEENTWCSSGLRFKHEDILEVCHGKTFSGRTTYYSYPALDHGSKYSGLKVLGSSNVSEATYNSKILYDNVYNHSFDTGPVRIQKIRIVDTTFFNKRANYDNRDGTPDWHRPMPKDLPMFNSKNYYSKPLDYTKNEIFELGHDCIVDPFKVEVDINFSSNFPWASFNNTSSTSIIQPNYSTRYGHTGNFNFSKKILIENYEFLLSIKQVFTEIFTISEEFVARFNMNHESFYGDSLRYNSKDSYNKALTLNYSLGTILKFSNLKAYDGFESHTANSRNTFALNNLSFKGFFNEEAYHRNWIGEQLEIKFIQN